MSLEHSRCSTNDCCYYYCFWAGGLHGDGSRVPSAELPAEVCVTVCDRVWGDCSLGACLEEALGIGPLEEGKKARW